jgi:tetratricopeptide (TPR) repeat protein
MKQIYFQLIITLLCVSCTHPTADRTANRQPQTVLAPDSLWTPSGDARLDSLLQLAAVAPQDTNLARLYYQIGEMYQDNDYEKAKAYYLKLEALSKQLDWNEGYYEYTACYTTILNREDLPDSALVILQKALDLARNEKNELWTANILANIGGTYFMKGWYEAALSYLFEVLP